MEATFIVGINFFQSEPDLLDELRKLTSKHPEQIKVLMGANSNSYTFHPKIYAFKGHREATIIVGSANLTGGGLRNNHEASMAITESGFATIRKIDHWIARLERDADLVEATSERIEEYRAQWAIARAQARLALARTTRALHASTSRFETLSEILREMTSDASEAGFVRQVAEREENREKAKAVLNRLASDANNTERRFLASYELLASGLWHSGGLHRGKTRIAPYFAEFQQALQSIRTIDRMSVPQAYRTLYSKLESVERTGTNVITEILHTFDNVRFAVMNQNSVSGLRLAGFKGFPEKPNRGNITSETYEQFCLDAATIRTELELSNFTQLDAVFNYAYWSPAPDDDNEDDDT
jgi:hypothetical protein